MLALYTILCRCIPHDTKTATFTTMNIDVTPQAVHAYHALKRYLKMRMSAPFPIVVMRVRQVPTQVAYAATLGLPAPQLIRNPASDVTQYAYKQR